MKKDDPPCYLYPRRLEIFTADWNKILKRILRRKECAHRGCAIEGGGQIPIR
jgi:hypothetical protein